MTEKKKDNCELLAVKETVANRADQPTWEDLEKHIEKRDNDMSPYWEEVARLLSYRVQDFRMAFEPWGKVIDHIQHNHPPGLKLGSSIAEFVLELVKEQTGDTTGSDFKAYSQGYRDASKKAIEIITKGL